MKFALCILLLACSTQLNAANAPIDTAGISERERIAQQLAPVNSAVRLQEHLQALSADSPLRSLSPAARDRFISSLKFNENGVTGFSYADIERELGYADAHRLLALFGAERTLNQIPELATTNAEDERVRKALRRPPPYGGADHPGYTCTGRATCSMSSQQICMSGC